MTASPAESVAIPEIPMSKGDLALVLGRYKSLHYVAGMPMFDENRIVHLVNGEGPNKICVPVVITLSGQIGDNSASIPLDKEDLKRAGRYTTRPTTHATARPRSAASMKKRGPARDSARAFIASMAPEPPSEILPRDVAGGSAQPLQEIRFTLCTKAHLQEAADVKAVRRAYYAAYHSSDPDMHFAEGLAHAVVDAHQFVFGNERGKSGKELPAPPETDDGGVHALRYLARRYKPFKLDLMLSRMRESYELLSVEHALASKNRHVTHHTTADHPELEARRIAHAPEYSGLTHMNASVGKASLIAMNAIQRHAVTEPLDLSYGNREKKGVLAIMTGIKQQTYINAKATHCFDLPVVLSHEPAAILDSIDLTDVDAKAHGYLTASNMRTQLGIKPGERRAIYSYAVRVAHPADLPFQEQAATARYDAVMQQVADAWASNGDSVTRAGRLLMEMPVEQRARCLEAIAPKRDLKEQDRFKIPNARGTRNVPLSVARTMRLPTVEAIGEQTAAVARERSKRVEHPPGQRRKGGDGWKVR